MPDQPSAASLNQPDPRLRRHYVKACEREDFDDERVRATIRDVVPGLDPDAELHRKWWEYAMLIGYLEDVDALQDDAQVLAVAAGNELPLFWLANRVGRVVATDIYGDGDFAAGEARHEMLENPSQFAPYSYPEDRLEVRHMNALQLEFPDAAFDIVYSLSSIEHFGSHADIQQAAREMSRVLKPGGHLIIVTECFIEPPRLLDRPLVQFGIRLATLNRRASGASLRQRSSDVFTLAELTKDVIDPVEGRLVQPLDLDVSQRSFENLIEWRGENRLFSRTGATYPHITLKLAGPSATWTSVCLIFRKGD